MAQIPGRRWTTGDRRGPSHQEAGSKGGSSHTWAPPRSLATQREAALRYWSGEKLMRELCVEYGVARTTMRRWCARLNEESEAEEG